MTEPFSKSFTKNEKEPSVRKSCYNCLHQRFGWKDDGGWDSCDEVCQIGPIGTLLFCIHGMNPQQVTEKLKEMSCHRWSEMK